MRASAVALRTALIASMVTWIASMVTRRVCDRLLCGSLILQEDVACVDILHNGLFLGLNLILQSTRLWNFSNPLGL
jgi:hypothetical protein